MEDVDSSKPTDDITVQDVSSSVRRGRGRPKKIVVDKAPEKKHMRRGRPPLSFIKTEVNGMDGTEGQVVVKRKRGRPKKPESELKQKGPKKPRGRPRKYPIVIGSHEQINPADLCEPQLLVKGNDDDDFVDPCYSDDTSKTLGKLRVKLGRRGRPRKTSSERLDDLANLTSSIKTIVSKIHNLESNLVQLKSDPNSKTSEFKKVRRGRPPSHLLTPYMKRKLKNNSTMSVGASNDCDSSEHKENGGFEEEESMATLIKDQHTSSLSDYIKNKIKFYNDLKAQKKRRGRAPKYPLSRYMKKKMNLIESCDMRPVGRPRKYPPKEIKDPLQPKRKRGRPRKNPISAVKVKYGKRGRPRSRPDATSLEVSAVETNLPSGSSPECGNNSNSCDELHQDNLQSGSESSNESTNHNSSSPPADEVTANGDQND